MPFRNRPASVLLCALLLVTAAVPAMPQCDSLLQHGIYDVYDSARSTLSVRTYMDWFCDTDLHSNEEAANFGASLSFPFEGVPIKLGFDSSKSSWNSWYHQVCAQHRSGRFDYTSIREHLEKVNPAVLRAFEACINADGLHIWLERTGTRTFRVASRYVNPGKESLPTITAFVVPRNVKCELKLKGVEISGATYRVPCERSDDEEIAITVNATKNIIGGGGLTLPAIWRPTAAVATDRFPIYVTNAMITSCVTRTGKGDRGPCGEDKVVLGGVPFNKGVIYTQPGSSTNGSSHATFPIPDGARSLSFSVGDYYEGADCRQDYHKKPLLALVEIDGQIVWGPISVIPTRSHSIVIPKGAHEITLRGNTGDGPVDCDDGVWVNVAFDN